VPGANVVTTGVLTSRDVAALRARGSELSSQLSSAANRRADVQRSLRNATGADRAGLEQRLGVLDTRIAKLEGDIAENGSQLASLQAGRIASNQPPFMGSNSRGRQIDNNIVPIAIVFTIFVLAPIALSIARMFWKRGSLPKHAPQSADHTQRLERMEQAIDSIAIEIERVSEGQRFVTRLMSDRQNAALEPAKPVSAPERLGVPR
jgi:TolA-binding protein